MPNPTPNLNPKQEALQRTMAAEREAMQLEVEKGRAALKQAHEAHAASWDGESAKLAAERLAGAEQVGLGVGLGFRGGGAGRVRVRVRVSRGRSR